MSSKLKKLKDLERKLTVSIPVEDYNSKFQSKLNNIKGQAKLDGFRKGKVPNDVLEQRYGKSIHADVVNDLIQSSYPEALAENKIPQHQLLQLILRVKIHQNLYHIRLYLRCFLR